MIEDIGTEIEIGGEGHVTTAVVVVHVDPEIDDGVPADVVSGTIKGVGVGVGVRCKTETCMVLSK